MYCAQSSKWGLFGRNTRSAIRGTSSLKKSAFSGKSTRISFGSNKHRKASARQMLRTKDAVWYWQSIVAKSRERSERTLAFGNKVAKNVAGGIGRLVPPLSPKIENFRGPHRKITLSCKSVEQATQREPLVSAALFCIFSC